MISRSAISPPRRRSTRSNLKRSFRGSGERAPGMLPLPSHRTCPLHPDARLSWDAHADAVPRCLRLRDAPLQSNTTRHTVDRRPPEYERASRRVGNGAPCVADGFPAKNPIGVPKLVDRRSRPDDVTTASARLPIRDVRVTG